MELRLKIPPNGPFVTIPKYEKNGTTSSLVWVERGNITYESLCALNEKNLERFNFEKVK